MITKGPSPRQVSKSVEPIADDAEYRQAYTERKEIRRNALYLNNVNHSIYYVNGFAKDKATGNKLVIYTDVATEEVIARPAEDWFRLDNEGKPLHVIVKISNNP